MQNIPFSHLARPGLCVDSRMYRMPTLATRTRAPASNRFEARAPFWPIRKRTEKKKTIMNTFIWNNDCMEECTWLSSPIEIIKVSALMFTAELSFHATDDRFICKFFCKNHSEMLFKRQLNRNGPYRVTHTANISFDGNDGTRQRRTRPIATIPLHLTIERFMHNCVACLTVDECDVQTHFDSRIIQSFNRLIAVLYEICDYRLKFFHNQLYCLSWWQSRYFDYTCRDQISVFYFFGILPPKSRYDTPELNWIRSEYIVLTLINDTTLEWAVERSPICQMAGHNRIWMGINPSIQPETVDLSDGYTGRMGWMVNNPQVSTRCIIASIMASLSNRTNNKTNENRRTPDKQGRFCSDVCTNDRSRDI